ncbi:MAG TPA: hypothetical protein VF087_08240 [Solirubrobacteraceae bacterium]
MARLPVLHKRRTKTQKALDATKRAAKVVTVVKLTAVGGRAAKKGAKAYGTVKGVKVVGRPVVKVAAIPVTVAGGVVVWRKLKSSDAPDSAATAEAGRPLGPVANASSVSPPADAAVRTAGSDS